MSALDDVRFWLQVVGDAQRTLVVPPDLESRAIETVKARGLDHVVTVRVSQWLPDNMVLMVDEQALEADQRQALQRCSVQPFFGKDSGPHTRHPHL